MSKKELVKLIFIIFTIISIYNGFTLTSKKMTVFNGIPWDGECYMQGRKELPEQCIERKEKNLANAKKFLKKNEQKMKLIQLICLVTIIVLAFIIKKTGYTITTLVVALTSILPLIL